MTKKMKQALLGTSILVVFTITVYMYYSNSHQKSKNINDESNSPVSSENSPLHIDQDEPLSTDTENQNILNPPADNSKVVKLFESLKSAGDVVDLANSLLFNGRDGLAKDILKNLHSRCGYLDGFTPVEKTVWWDKYSKYCDDYDRSTYHQIMNSSIQNPLTVPDFQSLLFDEEIESIQDASDRFIDMLSQVESRSSLVSVSDAMRSFIEGLGSPLQLGQDDEQINPLDMEYVQNTAINLYACEVFGGCGSNDYLTLETCVISNQCQPGWTMYDFYQNTLSPVNFEQVNNILNNLRSRIPGS